MDEQDLPFLEDEAEEVSTPEPKAEAPKEPEQGVEPKAEEPEAKTEPPAVEEKPSTQVPITALLDEREKRQKAQQEAEYYRRLAEQAQKPQEKPDFYEDPEKYAAHQQQTVSQMVVEERKRISRFLAEKELGADAVREAVEWFNDHPQLSHQLLNEPSPYHAAVEFVRKQKLLSEMGADPEGWRQSQLEALKAQARAELQAEIAQQAPSKPAAPPRSLARAPSAGGEANPPGSAFDELFPG
jgi:hypothetical protein